MKTYVLYIHDRRYSVPHLDSVTVQGDERAGEIAAQRLASSKAYFAAEVWEDDRLVCKLEKEAGADQT